MFACLCAIAHLALLVQRLYAECVGSYVNDGAQLEPVSGVGRPHRLPVLHGSPSVSAATATAKGGTESERRATYSKNMHTYLGIYKSGHDDLHFFTTVSKTEDEPKLLSFYISTSNIKTLMPVVLIQRDKQRFISYLILLKIKSASCELLIITVCTARHLINVLEIKGLAFLGGTRIASCFHVKDLN